MHTMHVQCTTIAFSHNQSTPNMPSDELNTTNTPNATDQSTPFSDTFHNGTMDSIPPQQNHTVSEQKHHFPTGNPAKDIELSKETTLQNKTIPIKDVVYETTLPHDTTLAPWAIPLVCPLPYQLISCALAH
eukprot:3475202-Rhodomonas_salina.2